MFCEAIEYLFTACPKDGRAIGYLYESIAISARAKRQKRAWTPHTEKTQAFIDLAIQKIPRGGVVWVLGSGGLFDIPLEKLCQHFQQVFLLDIVHPLAVRRQIRKYPQVTCLTIDLTTLAERLSTNPPDQPLPHPVALHIPAPTPNLVLSINLWAQLPMIPATFAHSLNYPPESIEVWKQAILAHHYDFLYTMPCPVCVVTETQRTFTNIQTGDSNIFNALEGIPLPPCDQTWEWNIAPAGEIAAHIAAHYQVQAFQNFRFA